jgi:hypothetical protein
MLNTGILGVVLLEIGLWECAPNMGKVMSAHSKGPYALQAQLQRHADRRLSARIGDKYKQIVLKYLSGDFGVVDDTKEDLKLQQAFRSQVLEVLEGPQIVSNCNSTKQQSHQIAATSLLSCIFSCGVEKLSNFTGAAGVL